MPVRATPRGGDIRAVKPVFHVAHAADPAHRPLDPVHLLFVVNRAAENDDPTVGIDAYLSLGNAPVAEQFALHLTHKADIVQLRGYAVAVRDRVRESDHLARLVMRLALDPPSPTTNCAHGAIAQKVSSALAAAGIEEELK